MAMGRVKEHNGTEEDEEPESMFKDRISALPETIIIHILSFLPTIDVVRMSLLSKLLRPMWTLVSALNFCDSRDGSYFRRSDEKIDEQKKFSKFVDECLKNPFADTIITKFELNIAYFGAGDHIDNWLRFPVKKNVKELELCVWPMPMRSLYCLPSTILRLTTLTLLKLSRLELEIRFPIVNLPSLKVLYLSRIGMDNQALSNLLLGCPSLEKLDLYYCVGLLDPIFFSLTLKSMEYSGPCLKANIRVEAMNLHSFVYNGGFIFEPVNGVCNVDLVSCSAIRNLTFSNAILTDQLLEDLIPRLPHLESLSLKGCSGFKHIKIWNQQLKHFVFAYENHQLDSLEATFHTPSLVSFSYDGHLMIKISMNTPNLLDANIKIYEDIEKRTYDMEWYTSLINFLSQLNGCKNVSIFCDNEKALIIPNELREVYPSPLSNLKYLKVTTSGSLSRNALFGKSLRWISPSSETLSI